MPEMPKTERKTKAKGVCDQGKGREE